MSESLPNSFFHVASERLTSLLNVDPSVSNGLILSACNILGVREKDQIICEHELESVLEIAVSTYFEQQDRHNNDDSSSREQTSKKAQNLGTTTITSHSTTSGMVKENTKEAECNTNKGNMCHEGGTKNDLNAPESLLSKGLADLASSSTNFRSPILNESRQKTVDSFFAVSPGKRVKTQSTLAFSTSTKKRPRTVEDNDAEQLLRYETECQPTTSIKHETDTKEDAIDTGSAYALPFVSDGTNQQDEPPDLTKYGNAQNLKQDSLSQSAINQDEDTVDDDLLKNIVLNFSSDTFNAPDLAYYYQTLNRRRNNADNLCSPLFSHLAMALSTVCSTTKRLEKEIVLTNLFLTFLYYDRAKLDTYPSSQDMPENIDTTSSSSSAVLHAALLAGNVATEGLVMNVGYATLSQAICSTLCCSSTVLRNASGDAGEMGDGAASILTGRPADDDTKCTNKKSTNSQIQSRISWASSSSKKSIPKDLVVSDILRLIHSLHQMGVGGGGKGIETRRKDAIQKVLSLARHPDELRFVIKILCQNMRTGATLITVMRCVAASHVLYTREIKNAKFGIGEAKANDKPGFTNIKVRKSVMNDQARASQAHSEIKLEIKECQDVFRLAYARHHSIKRCILALVNFGTEGLSKFCNVEVGVPVQPMLASPCRSIEDAVTHYFEHFRIDSKNQNDYSSTEEDDQTLHNMDVPFITAEYKYDGQRAQIHCFRKAEASSDSEALNVQIFSRHLDDMTEKFKSIASFIISNLPPSVTSCMLDTEIVAVERKQGAKSRILPFQVLSTMKKSELCEATRDDLRSCHDDTGLCIFVFDLVAFNGSSLVDWKLQYRRDRLRQVLAPMITPGYFEFAKSSDISFSSPDGTEDMDGASSTIERFLNDAIGVGRCEGLMLKSLHSRYSSNESREKSGGMGGWRKLKKDYIDSLADSFDCVPIGAWRGTGRKNAWFSPFLLAVYNSVTGEFQSICRCMSGFSDAFYEEKYKFYSTRLIDEGKPSYISTEETPSFWFEPCEVWEIRGADLTLSPVHHAAEGLVVDELYSSSKTRGIALRFPRFIRVRTDKSTEDATTDQDVHSLFLAQSQRINQTS